MSSSSSIHASFLTAKDLQTVGGLHIGRSGQPKLFVARSYMDKTKPISMGDGTPKRFPPEISPSRGMSMTSDEFNQVIGLGAGSYYGEMVYWHNHGGQKLGKLKWESAGVSESDMATCGEVWDMRWVFPTSEQAIAFHRDMLAASRAEDGNGYLDGLNERAQTAEELSLIRESTTSIQEMVIYSNSPRPLPTDPMQRVMAMQDAPSYCQQYGAVFVVDRVVIKIYVISGFNSVLGGVPRHSIFQLAIAVEKVVRQWLDGTRTKWDRKVPALVSNCAYCAALPTPENELKTCTRCRTASYCGRACQVGDFKHHKIVCKRIAASRAQS